MVSTWKMATQADLRSDFIQLGMPAAGYLGKNCFT